MKKHTKILIIIVAVLGLVSITPKAVSFAKYVSGSIWNYYLESKEFYFSSDQLDITTKENVNNNWNGKSVYFNLKNSLNDIAVTDYDITYKVTCTTDNEDISCNLNNSNSNTYEGVLSSYETCVNGTDATDVSDLDKETCQMSGYDWKKTVSTADLFFDLTSDKEIENVNVTVEVQSLSPYKKTLTGTFSLQKDNSENDKVTLNYNSYETYSRLVVSNNNVATKCARLTWDSANIKIDDTDLSIESYETDEDGYINEITFSLDGKSNRNFKFYESTPNEYTVEDFTLIDTDC